MKGLTADRNLIFRITHIDNVPWILEHGLQSRNSKLVDPNFVSIGNEDLIQKRTYRDVPAAPGGTLADYVPFYFTPHSPMLYNIRTGYNGIKQRSNAEIVVFVTSLQKFSDEGRPFLFTDRHAYLLAAKFTSDLGQLDMIPWQQLQDRDFKRDPEVPDKMERYQAEALAHEMVHTSELLGIATADQTSKAIVDDCLNNVGCNLKVIAKPGWYFQ